MNDCCKTNQVGSCYQCDKPICEEHRKRHTPKMKLNHPVYVCDGCFVDINKGLYGDRKVLRSKKIS